MLRFAGRVLKPTYFGFWGIRSRSRLYHLRFAFRIDAMDLEASAEAWRADVDCISCETVNSGDAFLYNKYPYSSSEFDLGIFLIILQ